MPLTVPQSKKCATSGSTGGNDLVIVVSVSFPFCFFLSIFFFFFYAQLSCSPAGHDHAAKKTGCDIDHCEGDVRSLITEKCYNLVSGNDFTNRGEHYSLREKQYRFSRTF